MSLYCRLGDGGGKRGGTVPEGKCPDPRRQVRAGE